MLLEAPQIWRMKRYNVLETKLVYTHKEIKVQVCTPKMSQYQPHLGRNLAPQSYKFAPVRVLVFTRISVHPSECKPAPAIFAPLGVQICTPRMQKCFYDCKHEYLGFKRAPLSQKVQVCSPKVQLVCQFRVQT